MLHGELLSYPPKVSRNIATLAHASGAVQDGMILGPMPQDGFKLELGSQHNVNSKRTASQSNSSSARFRRWLARPTRASA